MRNIFNNPTVTTNHNKRSARMFGTANSTATHRTNSRRLSYEPNQLEDEIAATAIVNEMELEKRIRFRAENP